MTLVPLSFWYMKHSIGNTFKRHKIMFIFLVLFVVGLIVLSNIANEKEKQKAQEASESGVVDEKKYDVIPEFATLDKLYDTEDGLFIGDANGKVHEMGPIIIEGVVFMIVILVVGISFATGAKSGANFFSMADVNFLYKGSLTVKVGDTNDLRRKLELLQEVVGRLPSGDKGTLDVSEGTTARFLSDSLA